MYLCSFKIRASSGGGGGASVEKDTKPKEKGGKPKTPILGLL